MLELFYKEINKYDKEFVFFFDDIDELIPDVGHNE
jgi:hypothetical protein